MSECPGCIRSIDPNWDEVCCDDCWRRLPLRLRRVARMKRVRSNWLAYVAALEDIAKWLGENKEVSKT